jgi:hypothetical protein
MPGTLKRVGKILTRLSEMLSPISNRIVPGSGGLIGFLGSSIGSSLGAVNDFYDGWKSSKSKSKIGKFKDAPSHSTEQFRLDNKQKQGMPLSSLIKFNE